MISLRLWLDKYCLISVQRRPLKAIADTYHSLLEHRAPKSTGEILVLIVRRLFFRMQPTFSELGDQIEDLEDILIENPAEISSGKIVQLRKKIMIFRRYLAPQKQAIAYMLESDIPWLDKHSKRQLRESLDTVTRHLENLDSFRDRAQILSDELAHFHAGKMNQNMYILSLIAAIFLPLTFFPACWGEYWRHSGRRLRAGFCPVLRIAICHYAGSDMDIPPPEMAVGQGTANRQAESRIDGLILQPIGGIK